MYFKRTRGLTDVIVAIVLRQCDSSGVIEPARRGMTESCRLRILSWALVTA